MFLPSPLEKFHKPLFFETCQCAFHIKLSVLTSGEGDKTDKQGGVYGHDSENSSSHKGQKDCLANLSYLNLSVVGYPNLHPYTIIYRPTGSYIKVGILGRKSESDCAGLT